MGILTGAIPNGRYSKISGDLSIIPFKVSARQRFPTEIPNLSNKGLTKRMLQLLPSELLKQVSE